MVSAAKVLIPAILIAIAVMVLPGIAPPSFTVSGGIVENGAVQPLLFTWKTAMPVTGSGWAAGETVQVLLHGPLNSPGVSAAHPHGRPVQARGGRRSADALVRGARELTVLNEDIVVGTVTADAAGNLSSTVTIPYDSGIVGPGARIPRPGLYEVQAAGRSSGLATASDRINLCPATASTDSIGIDWGHERGGRDGVLPGNLRQYSPERFDPEWATVWDERPVELYGTIAPIADDPEAEASRISPSDNPATHYAHDDTHLLAPDSGYRWLVGTVNYDARVGGPAEIGRLEVEWETRNGGSTDAYGQGPIGIPLWAKPTVGDRVYVVGRWILDAGHPEVGDRTEIHAARLAAVMRGRPVAASNGSAASQVDIFVSGHGGGANQMPPALSAALMQGGHGGGRIRDVLGPADQDRYYRPGPLAPVAALALSALVRELSGESLTLPVFADAGPSAFGWGAPSPEVRPVNDMDYDFDVPLPPAPAGATSPAREAVTHPEHTTSVTELVTYTATTAHIHLPYRGADDGIYARTLRFHWNVAAAPAGHVVVRLLRVNVKGAPGRWRLWADVSGQWTDLTALAPALLNTGFGQSIALPDNRADVYLGSAGALRVLVQGYRATCLDGLFTRLFGQSPYAAGISLLTQCGPIDNQDLGAALLQQDRPDGAYTITARDESGNSYFSVDLTVGPS
ncbi:MAG TPA: hypothetical protein VGF59_01685 [Bryobacteraceae bacterium]|jgi:hypothetical protein